MNKKMAPQTEKELLEHIADLFSVIEPDTPEEVDAILREAGFDPEAVGARMKKVAEDGLAHSALNWRNRARLEMAEEKKRRAETPPGAPRSRPDAIAAILAMAAAHQLAIEHRNLESLTDEDLLTLLADLEYLERRSRSEAQGPKD